MPKTEIVQMLSLPLQGLKRAFCNHCLASGIVNMDLVKADRNLLMEEHWLKFWTELDPMTSVLPMRVSKR